MILSSKDQPSRAPVFEKLTVPQKLTELFDSVSRLEVTDARLASGSLRIIELAKRLGDHEKLVQGSLRLAQHYVATDEFSRVADILEPLLERPGDLNPEARAEALLMLTRSFGSDSVTKVLRYGNEALKYYQLHPDPELQLELHTRLGRAYMRCLALPEALEHQQAALSLAEAHGFKQAEIYNLMGWVHSLLGDHVKAIDYLETGVQLAQKDEDITAQGTCYCNLSNIYSELEQYEKALEYSHRATAIFEAQGKFIHAMTSGANTAYAMFRLGDRAAARAYYEKILVRVRETPYPLIEGWTLLNLGETWLAEDSDRAEALMQRGLRVMQEVGGLEGVPEAYKVLAEHFEKKGDFAKALSYHRSYAELEIKKFKEASEQRTEALSIKFEIARLQQEQEVYQLKNVELARVVTQLEELSVKDSLTGLYNRRYLDSHLKRTFKEAKQSHQVLGVLISDIDTFKQINDRFSHAIGDEVIRIVAKIFRDNVRSTDVVARFGGEEYVVILQNTELDRVRHVAEKLRRTVADYPWAEVHPELSVTVSIGLCTDMALNHYEKMLVAADRKLYEAKRGGRNQVR